MLGLVRAPTGVVEPLIAASIVFVGNLLRDQMDSLWKLTFAFGWFTASALPGRCRILASSCAGRISRRYSRGSMRALRPVRSVSRCCRGAHTLSEQPPRPAHSSCARVLAARGRRWLVLDSGKDPVVSDSTRRYVFVTYPKRQRRVVVR